VKESRYTDGTELWAKAKQEVTGIMQLVRTEKPFPNVDLVWRIDY
jgi:hypothetical protein